MQMTSLASGSSGNSTLISSDSTHILIDAGISCRRIETSLNKMGLSLSDLSGIFITHEHIDHVSGLKTLLKKNPLPLYGTKDTLLAIKESDRDNSFSDVPFLTLLPDQIVSIGDLSVMPFSKTHDAADPVSYRVNCGPHSVAVCTDLGNYSEYTIRHLLGVEGLIIEANHDIGMLTNGRYPAALKRRILSDYGHLSNEACGRLLSEILHDNIRMIMLGHLSKENNLPELALQTVREEIDDADIPYRGNDFPIVTAKRDEMSETIVLS